MVFSLKSFSVVPTITHYQTNTFYKFFCALSNNCVFMKHFLLTKNTFTICCSFINLQRPFIVKYERDNVGILQFEIFSVIYQKNVKFVRKCTCIYLCMFFYKGLCYFLTLKFFGMLIRTKIYFLFALFLNLISIDKENDNILQVINFYQHAIWLSQPTCSQLFSRYFKQKNYFWIF